MFPDVPDLLEKFLRSGKNVFTFGNFPEPAGHKALEFHQKLNRFYYCLFVFIFWPENMTKQSAFTNIIGGSI
jgi:hypothetical protein